MNVLRRPEWSAGSDTVTVQRKKLGKVFSRRRGEYRFTFHSVDDCRIRSSEPPRGPLKALLYTAEIGSELFAELFPSQFFGRFNGQFGGSSRPHVPASRELILPLAAARLA